MPKISGKSQFGSETLDEYDITGHLLLNRNIMVYGGSMSGKTQFVKYLLNLIQDAKLIPVFHLFTTTPKNFDGQVPGVCVHSTYDSAILREIYDRNCATTALYNDTNKIEKLRELYKMRPNKDVDKLLKEVDNKKRANLASVAAKSSPDELKSWEQELAEKTENIERDLLKKYIFAHIQYYKKQNLSKELKGTLECIDLNPAICIIFDDLAALIAGATKNEKKILREIYFQGRNQNITTFMTAQSDTSMEKEYRDNAHISIYADSSVTSTCFSSGRNMPKATANTANNLLKKDSNFFDRTGPNKIYRMLVLFRMLGNKLGVIISKRGPNVPDGSQAYWDFAKEIEKSEIEQKQNNPYFKRYLSRIDTHESEDGKSKGKDTKRKDKPRDDFLI
jgi:hypothetical protein